MSSFRMNLREFIAAIGAALAAVWAGVGYWLGRSHDAKQEGCCTPA